MTLGICSLPGLPNNLAYYYLRFGPDAAQEGPDAPAVFAAGVRVPLRWALAQLVSAQALEAAQRLLDSERTGRVEANIEMLEMGGQEGQGGQGGPPGPEAPSTQSWWSSAAAARWRWTLPSITTPDMCFGSESSGGLEPLEPGEICTLFCLQVSCQGVQAVASSEVFCGALGGGGHRAPTQASRLNQVSVRERNRLKI